MSRPKAYFINGGAGRVICSIPAFEKLAETDDDFIIVCEGGMDFYKGHPLLHNRAYDNWHKGLFEQHIKHRDIVSPEPYRIWEYYNQKCSLSQAFDLEINKQGIRELPRPKVVLNKLEIAQAYNVVQEVKAKTGFDKTIVIQPFGRGVQNMGEMVVDASSRSINLINVLDIINELKKEYAIILMSEFPIELEENDTGNYPVAMPMIPDIRIWSGIIDIADHFVGVDSVGQHIAYAFNKTATVITGSTYPINISYPNCEDFDIFDMGEGKRVYDPIRISIEDEVQRANDEVMEMDKFKVQEIISSIRKRLGKSTKFKGKFVAPVDNNNCCTPSQPMPPSQTSEQRFSIANNSLIPLTNKDLK
jgi:ADP-heptose:LPS heptosyltransferase